MQSWEIRQGMQKMNEVLHRHGWNTKWRPCLRPASLLGHPYAGTGSHGNSPIISSNRDDLSRWKGKLLPATSISIICIWNCGPLPLPLHFLPTSTVPASSGTIVLIGYFERVGVDSHVQAKNTSPYAFTSSDCYGGRSLSPRTTGYRKRCESNY